LVVLLFAGAPLSADCTADHLHLRWDGGQIQFSIELADTETERARGLMNRSTLGRFQGMLFAYDQPRPVAFWMKNTLIPLDIIFFDTSGVVTKIHENAVPHDLTNIFGGESIQYVLEINGGMSSELGIGVGAELRYPMLNVETASWPCENSD
jgi:uncharacterized membrane protein (UPF0127 family)